MKRALKRVEDHTRSCSVSNLPGGQGDCTTCQKWQGMIKLREHYRRKLIHYMKQTFAKHILKDQSAGSHERAAEAAAEAAARAVKGGPPPLTPTEPRGNHVQNVAFMLAGGGGVPNLASGLDHWMPSGTPGGDLESELDREMRLRDERLGAMGSFGNYGGAAPLPSSLFGGCGGGGGGGGGGLRSGDPFAFGGGSRIASIDSEPGGERKRSTPAVTKGERARKAQKTDKGKSPAAAASGQPLVSRSGRQIKKAHREGMVDAGDDDYDESSFSDTSSMRDDYDMTNLLENVREERMMGTLERTDFQQVKAAIEPTLRRYESTGFDELQLGMHVAIDMGRPTNAMGGAPPPSDDPTLAIMTRPTGHGPTNIGRVCKVLFGGQCAVKLTCCCAAGSGEELSTAQAAELRGRISWDKCNDCSAGKVVQPVDSAQRQIVCSGCLHVNLPMALPQLWCSGCNRQVKSGEKFWKDRGQRLNLKLCKTCYSGIATGDKPEYLQEFELDQASFANEEWNPKDVQDNDHWVNCEGGCNRWFHYICAMYPDAAHLDHSYELELQKFICADCRDGGVSMLQSARLLALQRRRAASLPRHALSDAIESYVADSIAKLGVTCDGLCVRVVTHKPYKFPAVAAMKERYPDYPDEFPYDSRGIFVFQDVGEGRDICIFAMYVQEYGPTCPQPNTNRTYISYLDSVRYLKTSPPDQRTPVYHAIINGYLAHARGRGFEKAHIWVAPPQPGDEYIFHRHPPDKRHGNKPMNMGTLRNWYVKMLETAKASGIVAEYSDLLEHVNHLESIRQFPLFEGDFFPDHLRELLNPPSSERGPPGLEKQKSSVLVKQMKDKTKSMRKRFLVARLAQPDGATNSANGGRTTRGGGRGAEEEEEEEEEIISNALVDKRADFLGRCQQSHWQFNELRRAYFSTMMMLADLGGPPTEAEVTAAMQQQGGASSQADGARSRARR